jgi:hypothetical protein
LDASREVVLMGREPAELVRGDGDDNEDVESDSRELHPQDLEDGEEDFEEEDDFLD